LTTTAIIKSGTTGIAQFAELQGVAPTLGVEVIPIGVRDPGEIERAVTTFARSPNGGLIVTGSAPAAIHRDLIVSLAARHKLSAVYYGRFIVTAGGLISYGPDLVDQHRRADGYVDRILKGDRSVFTQNDEGMQLAVGDVALLDAAGPAACFADKSEWLRLQPPRQSLDMNGDFL
jgi:putative ABC transport system substrate-binding protein